MIPAGRSRKTSVAIRLAASGLCDWILNPDFTLMERVRSNVSPTANLDSLIDGVMVTYLLDVLGSALRAFLKRSSLAGFVGAPVAATGIAISTDALPRRQF